ncbi:molybdate ABC transporter substrate-binding protein [Aestuariibacter halophilus]|uniref:Molybdate ABC transporter substrate-binding protein n=1 Tax=Fluctibacter halophilus TaxID=226011 RepID=A0ABS8G424_9ALTE|nr:molybdate ABC transporter substrate-binding protein [Aestuariibacter halophilus]MCC2615347.1 molybdate ABC transporter substrate-binding protein [Aestuariibacter halophilus]
MVSLRLSAWLLGLLSTLATIARAEPNVTVRVAVASNFAQSFDTLMARAPQTISSGLSVSVGSTGKLYSQIVHGAPFDVFLAADTERPQKLLQKGLTARPSVVVYARGTLVAVSQQPWPQASPAKWLNSVNTLVIANPRLAPYGRAAQQVLHRLAVNTGDKNLIRAESIAQALQFFVAGDVPVAFISNAQVRLLETDQAKIWTVPSHLYEPILQGMVLLKDASRAEALYRYLQSDTVATQIQQMGYQCIRC